MVQHDSIEKVFFKNRMVVRKDV